MTDKLQGIKNVSVKISPITSHKCSVYGKEATNFAFDVTMMNDGISVWYERRGEPKFGCDEHKPVSRVFSVEGVYITDL